MTKIVTGLVFISLAAFIIISFGNLNYNDYQPMAAHYICNNSWSDEKCKSCHVNVHDDVVNSYHVQHVNSYRTDGQWDPLFLNLYEKQGTSTLVRECGLCHQQGIPRHNPTIAAVAGQSECGRCHSKGELVFEIHDADGIVGGSITTDCRICHSGNITAQNQYLTHISDAECANKCHHTDVPIRAVMWCSDNYGSYDVHSKAGIGCIHCHVTTNHQMGMGNIIDRADPALALDGPVKQCIDCHTGVTHGMIVDAHLEKVSCEACHIPVLPGGQIPGGMPLNSIDWTKGYKAITYRTGDFQPVLAWFNGTVHGMPHPSDRDDPGAVLKPFNVIYVMWWDEGNHEDIINSPNSSTQWGSPIVLSDIRCADVNEDGEVSIDEMRGLDMGKYGKPDYPNAVVRNSEIYYSVSHNIVSGGSALGKSALWCADCHGNTSRIDWELLGYEADPARTDPPTDFTTYDITVEINPARPEPVEVESEQWLFKPFGGSE